MPPARAWAAFSFALTRETTTAPPSNAIFLSITAHRAPNAYRCPAPNDRTCLPPPWPVREFNCRQNNAPRQDRNAPTVIACPDRQEDSSPSIKYADQWNLDLLATNRRPEPRGPPPAIDGSTIGAPSVTAAGSGIGPAPAFYGRPSRRNALCSSPRSRPSPGISARADRRIRTPPSRSSRPA